MPVIVVGADVPVGRAIIEGFFDPGREIRAFVSDEGTAAQLRERGVKVALGDVSDESHIEAAATRCFTAVLVTRAIDDGRELAFATSSEQVLGRWANAVGGVQRVIWVHNGEPPPTRVSEVATVAPDDPDVVGKVVSLDNARQI